MTNVEFLVAFSVACGNRLRYVLPHSIIFKARCMDILTAMAEVNDAISAIDECQLNMNNLDMNGTPGPMIVRLC